MKLSPCVRIATVTLAAALVPGLSPRVEAQDAPSSSPKAPVEVKPIDLTVTPRSAPIPGFRYRLFPLESERTPGDAAPIYLRLHGEFRDGMILLQGDKPTEWLKLPLDQFPATEARAFVDRFSTRLQQIAYGARRRSCDWNYTLPEEKEHYFEILLPDVQEMRQWGRLQALKARVEIVEGKPEEAIRTLETGLAFARHVGEGPFLINALVGVSVATMMLERVNELIGRPDAPNLYWALTALPRPLIPMGRALENEMKMLEWMIPELAEVDSARSGPEWSSLLGRCHERMISISKKLAYGDPNIQKHYSFEEDAAKFRSTVLPRAQSYLKDRGRPVEGLPDDQVVMLFLAGRAREIRDDWSRTFYLPHADSAAIHAERYRRDVAEKAGPLGFFVSLAPAIESGQAAEARLDRKVAALRVVEAIRMQAAADGVRLPESLGKVTIVPKPIDPYTARPFEYRREGDAAFLTDGSGGPHPAAFRLSYRITLRK